MKKTLIHKRKMAASATAMHTQARHPIFERARGTPRDRAATELTELFRELRAWDELSAESLRAHGF